MRTNVTTLGAAAVLAALLMAAPAQAQLNKPTGQLSVGGAGQEPCSLWTKARQGTSAQDKADAQIRAEWISGFFTAANLYTTANGNLHGGVDQPAAMLGSIDAYCKARPTDPLFAAAAGLAMDLKNHPRK